jgi:mannose-6-phosphate isomerase-like protein (cupin superfamily)
LNLDQVAAKLSEALVGALQASRPEQAEVGAYLDRVVVEIESARLTQNPPRSAGIEPGIEWSQFFPPGGDWSKDALYGMIHALGPRCEWFRADRFYPRPEHECFSKRIRVAAITGQEDAIFNSGERYIAMLIIIAANTSYPLHAHRIEEAYYILSGDAQWSHDGEHWTRLAPGSVFHNRSWQSHAIRTGDQPMMAMGLYLPPFGWEGGLR